jgi:hypothetical protein
MIRSTVLSFLIALTAPAVALQAQLPVPPTPAPAKPAGGDSTTATVPAPVANDTTPNHPVVHECDAAPPGWIFCDDFESNRLGRYFEYSQKDSSFERADSVGVLGSAGMRVRFRKGQVDAGSLKIAFGKTPTPSMRPVDSGTATYHDLYWRVYVRNDSTWTGGGGDKLSRAQVLVTPKWAQAMGAPVWSGGGGKLPGSNYLTIDPYSGTDPAGKLQTTTYNDFPRLRWLGAVRGSTPIFDSTHVGKWYCVEAHVRLNDPGQSDGVFELWIDDYLEARHANLNWIGDFTGYGINTVFLENYWNAGSPVEQYRYMDNFVVSTQRIGCGRLIPSPSPAPNPTPPDTAGTLVP